MTPSSHSLPHLLRMAMVVAAFATYNHPSIAQSGSDGTAGGMTTEPTDGLEPAPSSFEVLGLSFRPPLRSVMRSEGAGKAATWIIAERAESPRYILRVSKVFTDAPSTPAAQIDEYVRSVSERPAPNAVFAVRSRREFPHGGRPAALLYTSQREGEGEQEISAVQGYFIVQVAPQEFAVISSLVADADFAAVSPVLERSFRTLEVLEPGTIADDRAARIGRGQRLVDGLGEARLRGALDTGAGATKPAEPRWYRISRADPDGAVQEVGYMTMSVGEAPQGIANPDRAEEDWDASEREKGLLVRIRMRTLLDQSGKAVSDTDARYWVRWDRQREFWTVRSTARAGKAVRTSAQLGFRLPRSIANPDAVIEVTDVEQSSPASEPKRWTVPPVAYLSQAEAMVLPRLLPRERDPARYGFYWFDTRSGRLAQRLDAWAPSAAGATVTTRRTLESPETVDTVDRMGALLRRESDDGAVVEATTGPDMLALWKRKGLPVE